MKMFLYFYCKNCDKQQQFKTFWNDHEAVFECTICGKYRKEGER